MKMKKGFTFEERKTRRGFTLIELLVVISIIGVLAGMTLVSYSAAQKQARDTTRRSDLAQYRNAIASYAASNNGLYPYDTCDTSCTGDSNANGGIFKAAADSPIVDEFMSIHIEDPTNTTTYRYQYWQGNSGIEFKLSAKLETGDYWQVCWDGRSGKATTVTANTTCNVQ